MLACGGTACRTTCRRGACDGCSSASSCGGAANPIAAVCAQRTIVRCVQRGWRPAACVAAGTLAYTAGLVALVAVGAITTFEHPHAGPLLPLAGFATLGLLVLATWRRAWGLVASDEKRDDGDRRAYDRLEERGGGAGGGGRRVNFMPARPPARPPARRAPARPPRLSSPQRIHSLLLELIERGGDGDRAPAGPCRKHERSRVADDNSDDSPAEISRAKAQRQRPRRLILRSSSRSSDNMYGDDQFGGDQFGGGGFDAGGGRRRRRLAVCGGGADAGGRQPGRRVPGGQLGAGRQGEEHAAEPVAHPGDDQAAQERGGGARAASRASRSTAATCTR